VARTPLRVQRTLDQLRQMRARLEQRHRVEHARRRVEDLFREEHRYAHATILNATATIGRRENMERATTDSYAAPSTPLHRMRIRVIKTIPAPLMDGFDVRALRVDHVYDVDSRMGQYLVIAGYAVPDEPKPPDEPQE